MQLWEATQKEFRTGYEGESRNPDEPEHSSLSILTEDPMLPVALHSELHAFQTKS